MNGVVAIIPARSGSKSLKDKNIRLLAGRPLLAWAILAAKNSKLVERVVVSTDSEEYARIAREWGAETPFMRPAPLAEDVPTEYVIMHAVTELEKTAPRLSIVVTIQCTTPLLQFQDIDACVSRVSGSPSAVTVTEMTEHPEWAFYMTDAKRLRPFLPTELRGAWGVRQNLPKLFRPNGAVYATRRDYLMKQKRLIAKSCYGVLMPRLRSFDVDTPEDFVILEAYIEKWQLGENPSITFPPRRTLF